MKFSSKDFLPFAIIIIPFVFLFVVWNQIPESVPIHYNIKGEADNFIEKAKYPFVLLFPVIIFFFVMLILKAVSGSIDNEDERQVVNKVSFKLSVILAVFFALLICFIVYNAAFNTELFLGKLIGTGVLLMVGFIFHLTKDIPQNPFIGVRTKWTLENIEVWKRTHEFCARKLFYLFLAGAVISFMLSELFAVLFSVVWMMILMAVSVWYSYRVSKSLQQ